MQRVTISLEKEIADAFDALSQAQGYQSRSEAIRDLIRREVDSNQLQEVGDRACVANLSYVYDHHVRSLAGRLVALQHDHHDLIVSTTHVHLDHDNCLESVILKGPIDSVRALADGIKAERGVRFAAVNLIGAPSTDAVSTDKVNNHADTHAREHRHADNL